MNTNHVMKTYVYGIVVNTACHMPASWGSAQAPFVGGFSPLAGHQTLPQPVSDGDSHSTASLALTSDLCKFIHCSVVRSGIDTAYTPFSGLSVFT